ncbi:hypothetical protein GGS23DRAFT_19481 [Durotheca rogersii]|uniref:uncharacterized protein n=1 Tax=Durotheca rogersii TaxID=419775 RepID=UPI00221EA68F|nr:uncharacterized protein GGS23DRAFT_19481 [Durotheca rogersii]KAI5868247.1 hypothetical protein GGS23DRAFT_19481 [Durotheca rogersii]
MSEYTSTREGFQRAMEESLSGRPEDSHQYAKKISTPGFYHLMNNQRISYDRYVEEIAEWRGKTTEYKPVIHEFLRDGDQLAARMTGTIKIDGADTYFESYMFAKLEHETGKMEWLVERAVWGSVGAEPEHGVN